MRQARPFADGRTADFVGLEIMTFRLGKTR